MIVAVYARDRNGVIGRDGSIPWRHKADMRLFRAITLHMGAVVMGRRTMESLPQTAPLKGRVNFVLSRSLLPEGFERWEGSYKGPLAVVGGAGVYRLFEPRVDLVVETVVDLEVEGDVVVSPLPPSYRLCYKARLVLAPGDSAPATVHAYLPPHSRMEPEEVSQWMFRFSDLVEDSADEF